MFVSTFVVHCSFQKCVINSILLQICIQNVCCMYVKAILFYANSHYVTLSRYFVCHTVHSVVFWRETGIVGWLTCNLLLSKIDFLFIVGWGEIPGCLLHFPGAFRQIHSYSHVAKWPSHCIHAHGKV